MPRARAILLAVVSLAIGVVIGGNLFAKTQPRSLIALHPCTNCLSPKELAGLLASVGIQQLPGFVPFAAVETEKTVAIRLPTGARVHYVLFPKRDLKDIGDFSEDSAPYLVDIYRVARTLIEREHLTTYIFITNGPGYQSVRYLHFHLQGK
jgi:hypothetical protein